MAVEAKARKEAAAQVAGEMLLRHLAHLALQKTELLTPAVVVALAVIHRDLMAAPAS